LFSNTNLSFLTLLHLFLDLEDGLFNLDLLIFFSELRSIKFNFGELASALAKFKFLFEESFLLLFWGPSFLGFVIGFSKFSSLVSNLGLLS